MSLHDRLQARIRAAGPISVADYMTTCLLDPQEGYYTTRDPLGARGDFVTAPEISQMFGELIGLALAQAWQDQGRPTPFVLAEAGPGRGTLMADALRATACVPGFHAAAKLWLVEASPVLQEAQRTRLAGFEPRWTNTLAGLPQAPLFLVANEFFDALPVRQFQRSGAGWRERRVGLLDGHLAMGLAQEQPQPALAHRLEDTAEGDVVEHSAAAQAGAAEIGQRIADHGGAALVIDYGDWRSLGDTLQALRAGAPAPPLEDAGNADLTTHVDFEALAHAAPCAHTRLAPQGVFLERLGITARAQALTEGAAPQALEAVIAAHRRLTHPEEMGNLFKVLGLYPAHQSPPPGLV